MNAFESDVRSQATVLQRVFTAYRDPRKGPLSLGPTLLDGGAPVLFAGMGSSLLAARSAAGRLSDVGRSAMAAEAGELLHYGLAAIPRASTVVLVSQSGRSIETLELARRLNERGQSKLVAVVNDETSPLADEASIVFPLLAGKEATVSTRTFVATFVVLNALADSIAGRGDQFVREALASGIVDLVAELTADTRWVHRAVSTLGRTDNLVVVGRGPALVAAEYAALILKETAAIPAESMPAGSFRHGPMEIVGPTVGVVVLAPDGKTRELSTRLAVDTARLGSPTWLVTNAVGSLAAIDGPVVSCLPRVPEAYAPILLSVGLQQFAAELARSRGKEPGAFRFSSKVTDVE